MHRLLCALIALFLAAGLAASSAQTGGSSAGSSSSGSVSSGGAAPGRGSSPAGRIGGSTAPGAPGASSMGSRAPAIPTPGELGGAAGGAAGGGAGSSQPDQTQSPAPPISPQQQPRSGASVQPQKGETGGNELPDQTQKSPAQPNQLDQQLLGSGGLPGGGNGTAAEPSGEAPAAESKAGGSLVELSDEQREKVRKLVLSYRIVQTDRANFPLRLGARIPPDVKLLPFPREVVDLIPEYRDYSYVIAGDRIVVVKTDRREIDLLIPT